MKYKKVINLLVFLIIILSIFSSIVGTFSKAGPGEYQIETFRGETIKIYGKGLYRDNSISAVSQGIAQDIVTLILGVPLLFISLYKMNRGSLKAKLLLTGTLGYFLYTYISYVFLWMYNSMFIVYVILMSASFFAFTLSIMSYDIESLSYKFNKKTPVKFLGGFQIFLGIAIFLLWIGRIIPSLLDGDIPVGLEHYTTLVIQALDLGFLVPIAIISGLLLIKKKPFGYLLSCVVITKGFTMAVAISAMIIAQYLVGVEMNTIETMVFPIISLMIFYCLYLLIKNIKTRNFSSNNTR